MLKSTIIQKKLLAIGKIGVMVNFIIQEWNLCQIDQLFLSVYLVGDNLRRLRGNLKHKNRTCMAAWE